MGLLSSSASRDHSFRAFLLFVCGLVAVYTSGHWDYVWTTTLYQNPWPRFTDIMSRSFFEGEAPGASDIAVVITIVAFILWLRRRRLPHNEQRREHLRRLKFVFVSSILAPVVTVQAIKFAVSRARPKVFFSDVLPTLAESAQSLDWLPAFLGWDGPRGRPWNSFPSGHSSSIAVLLVFAYMFGKTKIQKSVIILTIFVFTAAMAVARSMAGMHWLSDSVASFFVVWMVVDISWWYFSAKWKDINSP